MSEAKTPTEAYRTPGRDRDTDARERVSELRFRQLVSPDVHIDFVGKRKLFLILSTVLNLLAVALFFTRGFNFGIDFVGGTDIRLRFAEATSAAALRRDLAEVDLPDLSVQDIGAQGTEFLLRFEPAATANLGAAAPVITGALQKTHPGEKSFEVLSIESVGPKVGAALRRQGFLAVGCATILMGFYIAFRFEWTFGVGAVIALIHDVLIASGALMLSRMVFDLTTLAAMLTVVGFSVHDTIIVSDRIRENRRKHRGASLATVINQSINETLARTVLTTGTALLVLVPLLLVGGQGLKPFAFTLIVGFATGTYSSIYIAAPVVLFFTKDARAGRA